MSKLISGSWGGLRPTYPVVYEPINNRSYWNGVEWQNTVKPFSNYGVPVNVQPGTRGRAVSIYSPHGNDTKYIGVDFEGVCGRVFVRKEFLRRVEEEVKFKEMISHLIKTHEFSRSFAQRQMLRTCIEYAERTYQNLGEKLGEKR